MTEEEIFNQLSQYEINKHLAIHYKFGNCTEKYILVNNEYMKNIRFDHSVVYIKDEFILIRIGPTVKAPAYPFLLNRKNIKAFQHPDRSILHIDKINM